MFITFEGGEGSGKSTQAKLLAAALRAADFDVVECAEPGGTPLGLELRKLLLGTKMSARMELLLYNAARAELVETVIRPALLDKKFVVCDRFIHSTVAYQGYGRGLNHGIINQINDIATGGLVPDLTFLLDIDPALGLRRKSAENSNRFEAEELDFHQRVRSGYRVQASWDIKIIPLNANQSQDALMQRIVDEVLEVAVAQAQREQRCVMA